MKEIKNIITCYRFFILLFSFFLTIETISVVKAEPILLEGDFVFLESTVENPTTSPNFANPLVRYFPPGDQHPACFVLLISKDVCLEGFIARIVLRKPLRLQRYPYKTWRGRLDSVWMAQSFCNLRNQPMLA